MDEGNQFLQCCENSFVITFIQILRTPNPVYDPEKFNDFLRGKRFLFFSCSIPQFDWF